MEVTGAANRFAGEQPILALATVVQSRSECVFQLSLPNGKLTHGHIPNSLMPQLSPLRAGDTLRVEISPYDFERARIVAREAPAKGSPG